MQTKITLMVVLFSLISLVCLSQEKSKKELREEKKIEKQNQTEAMVNAREFVFVGRTANSSGMKSISLASNRNYVKFQPDMIESEMPFFGKAYGAVGYGGDSGLKFKGKPEEFTAKKGKKNYQVDAVVKGTNDNYRLSLNVGFEGSATLTITSNNRSPISYSGQISASK